jgi:hypothetical protein
MSARKVCSFSLTVAGYAALKVLEQKEKRASRMDIVSDALVRAAQQLPSEAVIKFNVIDPAELLLVRADISAEQAIYDKIRKDLLAIRPGSDGAAISLAAEITKVDQQIDRLQRLDDRLARTSSIIRDLTPQDHQLGLWAIAWSKGRIEHFSTEEGKKEKNAAQWQNVHRVLHKILSMVFEAPAS